MLDFALETLEWMDRSELEARYLDAVDFIEGLNLVEGRVPRLQEVLGLTPAQAQLVDLLMCGRLLTKGFLVDNIGTGEAGTKTIDVHLARLRPRLAKFGVKVNTIPWQGVRMPAKSVERVNLLLAEAAC